MNCRMLILVTFLLALTIHAQVAPIPGHAHNDYEHDRPLTDALANGFISVEVDVHLIDGELFVYHDSPNALDPERTLERLYLKPLEEHIRLNNGVVYPGHQSPFYLMIDFKTAAGPTYEKLKLALSSYRSMLSVAANREARSGPVKVLISGNRPVNEVLADASKPAGLDGRPEDLQREIPHGMMPVVSDHYANFLSWDGKGQVDANELGSLQDFIRNAHAQHKKVRLWGAPDTPETWKFLLDQGVDLINTDRLEAFRAFYNDYNAP